MSTPNPLPPILRQAKSTAMLTSYYLNTSDLSRLSAACKNYQNLFKNIMADRKRASELLSIVLNSPDSKTVQEFFAKIQLENNLVLASENKSNGANNKAFAPKNKLRASNNKSTSNNPLNSNKYKSIVLIRTYGSEKYYSKEQKSDKCKRQWEHISSLEAAAIAGDNFLVKTLLSFVPKNQLYKARIQLQAVRKSIHYLASYKALMIAYKEYVKHSDNPLSDLYPNLYLDKLRDLWLQGIGICQFLLPVYGLQEFCDNKTFHPLPNFKQEPIRKCYLENDIELDLDKVGKSVALYKGNRARCRALEPRSSCLGGRWLFEQDSLAIEKFCEVRTIELDEIIDSLPKPPINPHNKSEVDNSAENERARPSKRRRV